MSLLCTQAGTPQTAPAASWHDPSPHRSQMISVDKDVQLEVLDWGGTGRPLIFLSGLGNTAHIWDNFAPRFVANHHVYAITRRGFGRSTHAKDGYTTARLGDDVLEVMARLKIDKPVLVGHSIAGEELSSIGTHHPESVSALIYLDAAYTYAFYDAAGDYDLNLSNLQQKIDALARSPNETKLLQEVKSELPQFKETLDRKLNSIQNPLPSPYAPPTAEDKASYAAIAKRLAVAVGGTPPEAEPHESFVTRPDGGVGASNSAPEVGGAISKGREHFTTPIKIPILAVMGYPQSKGADFHADTPQNIAAAAAADANQKRQIDAFENGQPTAHVIRIANANHYIFISHEAQVIHEMNAFLNMLPQQ